MQVSRRIILGSGSPRRRELLAGLDLEFTVDTGTNFQENADVIADAHDVPLYMSMGKSKGFHRQLEKDEVLITSDTVVIVETDSGLSVLGKPHDRDAAVGMLRLLSGRSHEVVTAVTIRDSLREKSFCDTTKVCFKELSDEEMAYYVDKYHPYDKAGAYGIQEWIGYVGITHIEGSYFNVMGFPVHRVWEELQSFL